jgi:hypothetical protein
VSVGENLHKCDRDAVGLAQTDVDRFYPAKSNGFGNNHICDRRHNLEYPQKEGIVDGDRQNDPDAHSSTRPLIH